MCGVLAHFLYISDFQIASAKVHAKYAIFLRKNEKNIKTSLASLTFFILRK